MLASSPRGVIAYWYDPMPILCGQLVVFNRMHCFFVRVFPSPCLFLYLLCLIKALAWLEYIGGLIFGLSIDHWTGLEDNWGRCPMVLGILFIYGILECLLLGGDPIRLESSLSFQTAWFWPSCLVQGVFNHPIHRIATWIYDWPAQGARITFCYWCSLCSCSYFFDCWTGSVVRKSCQTPILLILYWPFFLVLSLLCVGWVEEIKY